MRVRIALLGLSGVGKSTLIGRLRQSVQIVHLQASALIKAEQAYRAQDADSSEALRLGAVMDNQDLIIAAYRREAQATALPIIFDGHNVIDGRDGLVEIPAYVFRALDLDAICFLSADPEWIAERRQMDASRARPARDAVTLAEHQRIACSAAERIAEEIGCRFVVIADDKIDQLIELVG